MLGLPGQQTRLFNARAVAQAGDTICITEGEFDAMILEQCGFNAVGVTGANAWKGKKHYPRLFQGFSKIYIFGDGDTAGRQFAKDVFDTVNGGVMVRLLDGLDVNDAFLEGGADYIRKLMGLDDE